MSGTPGTVVVVGSVNLDQVVAVARHPRPGETLVGTRVDHLPGGKGANQAVAAARRGAATALVGSVGRDPAAEAATGLLSDSGVDLTHLRRVDGATGFAAVTVDGDGENTIVVVPGANGSTDEAAVTAAAAVIAHAAVVVVQGEIPADGTAAAARLTSGRFVLNLAPVIPLPRAVVVAADPLVVNEHEAASALRQLDGESGGGASSTHDEDTLVDRLLAHGVRSVVITLGARGALVGERSEGAVLTRSVPSPRVAAVDTSGAGDAFVGALAARLASGATLLEAVEEAVRVGAFAVQHVGTQPSYPRLHERLPAVETTGTTETIDTAETTRSA